MDINTAYKVLAEHQKWRREMPPYDGETPETHRKMPYSAKEIGEALDVAIRALDNIIKSNNDTVGGLL